MIVYEDNIAIFSHN